MKKWWLFVAVSLTVCAGFPPGAARAQSSAPVRDIGKEVRGVFVAKCAGCNGPDLVKPKGRFGYILDLQRVAENPEMVIPSRPDESELWILVQRDEMPPADSPHGALTQTQKDIIGEWIAAGAPNALPGASDSRSAVESEPTPAPVEISEADRVLRWLGKLHLLLLHFPIALVLAAAAGEIRSVWQRNPLPSESVRFCLWLGALAVIPTAVMGWLFAAAGNGVSSPQLLTAHRWVGTATAAWLVITALCAESDARREVRSRRVRVLLAGGVLITALTAHLGGLLAHGEEFFAY